MPERDDRLRAFWSGTLTFGLVTLPVAFVPAVRSGRTSLRMLDEDGTPLRRRYWCPRDERFVDDEELVRGYEVEDGRFVVVTDDELEALAPEKTREIDLREFVAAEELDPAFFERAYFLIPDGESTKAYRLLAEAMESTGKAGVGTFVMRGREYVAAILARNGVLSAETMRFSGEVRSPEDVDLAEPARVPAAEARRFAAAIEALRADEPDWTRLEDPVERELERLVERKLARGEDVVAPPPEAAASSDEPDVIDIMEILKRSLQGTSEQKAPEDLEERSKEELYAMAQDLDIAGRSRMSKAELLRAIRRSA